MVGACGPPVCAFSIAALGAARAFDDPTLIDEPLNVEPEVDPDYWTVR